MSALARSIDHYVLITLIVLESLACYSFYSREIAWYPPGNYDQTYYLLEAYRTKELILTNGVGQLARALGDHYNNGFALPILGAVSGLFFTDARFSALLMSFVGFILLQLVAFFTGRAIWHSRMFGYMLLGLILCENTPWYWAGGVFDFRFDFIAYCFYGIWVCLVLRSNLFLHRVWAVVSGLVGAFLVLNRFIGLVYIFGTSAGLALVWVIVLLFRRGDTDLQKRMSQRFGNLLLSLGILALIAAPFIVNSREEIFHYYAVGHFWGGVKEAFVRQQALSPWDFWLFYPDSILRDHWGLAFCLGAGIVLLTGLVGYFTKFRFARAKLTGSGDESFLLQIVFVIGTILGPMLVLSADAIKNSVVGGIVGVPSALLVVILAARGCSITTLRASVIPKTVLVCSLAVSALGIGTVFDRLSQHLPEYSQRVDLRRLLDLNEWMAKYASEHGWNNPGFSVDVISPWLNAYSITDSVYEQSGKLIEFRPMLGRDPTAIDREEALSELKQSQFFLVTASNPPERTASEDTSLTANRDPNRRFFDVLRRLRRGYNPEVQPAPDGIFVEGSTASMQRWATSQEHLYTFYQCLAQYRNDLEAWTDKNMIRAKTVAFERFTVTVYVSRTAADAGLSDREQ